MSLGGWGVRVIKHERREGGILEVRRVEGKAKVATSVWVIGRDSEGRVWGRERLTS